MPSPPTNTSGTDAGNVNAPIIVVDTKNRRPNANATNYSDHALLRAELLELVTQANSDKTFREVFRGIALRYSGAAGCCHVIRDADGDWDVSPKDTTGRVPRRRDFLTSLSQRCDETVSRNTIQIEQLAEIAGFQTVLAPVPKPNSLPEIFALMYPDTIRIGGQLFIAQTLAESLQLWLRDRSVVQSNWKMASLAAMVELVSEIEISENRKIACQKAADHLARHLNCHSVAIGIKQPKMTLKALSGVANLKLASETSRLYLQTLNESVLRGEQGTWPAIDDAQNHLLLAHKQLAIKLQVESVYSIPLKTIDAQVIGSCVLTGPQELMTGERFKRFLSAAAPRLASSLEVVGRAEQSRLKRLLANAKKQIANRKTWATVGLIMMLLLTMLLPIHYRVRCSCSIQPIERRFAVAPFGGLIEQGMVRPGDTVTAGQVLAKMDGRTTRWELAQVNAERQQAIKKREVELADRAVAGALLAELESDRLAAKENLLNYQRDNLEIRCPIDGVVLSGSKDHFESASVETGQVIYEIGPLSPVRLQIEIPANDRAQIDVGMAVNVWIDGQEGKTIVGKVSRIYPRSELRNSKNVFVAECEFDNSNMLLRPGMEGHARIDGSKRPLGWCLFHKPWGFVKSRLSMW